MKKHRGNVCVGYYDNDDMAEIVKDPRGKEELTAFVDRDGKPTVYDTTTAFGGRQATDDEINTVLYMARAIYYSSEVLPVFDLEYTCIRVAEEREEKKKKVRKRLKGMFKNGISVTIWVPLPEDIWNGLSEAQ